MNRIRNLACFLVSAIVTALAVVACNRPGEDGAAARGGNGAGTAASLQAGGARDATGTSAGAATARNPAPQPAAPSDATISSRVKSAILADPSMAGADVSVNTTHGVVALQGTVRSHEQTGIASAHAQRQEGVMRVDNELGIALQ